MIEQKARQIDIKSLLIPERSKKTDYPVDPRSIVDSSAWKEIEGHVDNVLGGKSRIVFGDAWLLSSFVLVARAKITPKIDDDVWQRLLEGLEEQSHDFNTPAYLSHMFIINPERTRSEYNANSAWQERISALDKDLNFYKKLRLLPSLFIIDPTQRAKFSVNEADWSQINEWVKEEDTRGGSRLLLQYLSQIRILDNDRFKREYLTTVESKNEFWRKAYETLRNELKDGTIQGVVSLVKNMMILAADDIEITDSNIVINLPKEEYAFATRAHLPHRRRF
jgi:hypothetical protein